MKELITGKHFALKTILKSQVFRQPENACFMDERIIMSHSETRWLTHMEESFQDDTSLYLVMDYYAGGDLNSLDPEQKGLQEDMVRFYCAEVLLGLEELHRLGYAHRDVKPGNVMLGSDGHVRLTDFGSAGKIGADGKIFSRIAVGTPDYVSPEALLAQQIKNGTFYRPDCDWWGFGVLLFELLTGEPPFYAPSLVQTYQNITNHSKYLNIDANTKLSNCAKDLLKKLLVGPEHRISSEDIKSHPFFEDIEWNAMEMAIPPFIPCLDSPEDTSRFYLDDEDDDGDNFVHRQKGKKVFDGNQLPFVGYTFDSKRHYRVTFAEQPALRRIESCQIRMNELETQVDELKASCETAKLVSQQLKRITSQEDLDKGNEDDLKAAYDALLLNYEFLQTHYEELLGEHTSTSRQLEAMIVTLQEQEDSLKSANETIGELTKQRELDRLKIKQLVTKLATGLEGMSISTDMQKDGKEKVLLKQKCQELKHLEQQLYKESVVRSRLEQDLTDLKLSYENLQREHEALLLEIKPKSYHDTPIKRMKSILGHSRHASSVSSLQALAIESSIKILDGKSKKLKWIKTTIVLKETGIWIGDKDNFFLLASIKAPLFIAQPVQPGELNMSSSIKDLDCCFKIRYSLNPPDTTSITTVSSECISEIDMKRQLEKELKILKGAQQLYDAAKTAEQQAIAQSHIDASMRVVSDLEAALRQDKVSDTQSVLHHGHSLTLPTPSDDYTCDACFKTGATMRCVECEAVCHTYCQMILPVPCSEANQLRMIVPTYFKASSPDEARKWLRSIDSIRKRQ